MARRAGLPLIGLGGMVLGLAFLPPGAAGGGVVAMAAVLAWAVSAGSPIDWRRLWPAAPFLVLQVVAAARAAQPGLAAAYVSFDVPALLLMLAAALNPGWPSVWWMRFWSVIAAAVAGSVCVAWLAVVFGAAAAGDVPQAVLAVARCKMLLVPNDICLVGVLLAFPATLMASRRKERWLAGAALLLGGLAIIVLRSRTAALVAAVELVVLAGPRRRLLVWGGAAAVLAVAADALTGFGLGQKLALRGRMDLHGIVGRLGLWVAAWRMFCAAPLWGHGAQSFGALHARYLPFWAPRFPEGRVGWAHDLGFDVLAEQGILGATALSALLWPALRARVPGDAERHCTRAALAGLGVAACLELSLQRRYTSLLLFGIVAFAQHCALETFSRQK